MKIVLLKPLSLVLLVSASLVARAGSFDFSGELTSSSPTFNRPVANVVVAPGALSNEGTSVFYSEFFFQVDVSGRYDFVNDSSFDDFAALYRGALNPYDPLANVLIANDDRRFSKNAYFSYDLVAGRTYDFVFTTSVNGVTGSFTSSIGGPGNIVAASAVPGPVAALPFALLALKRRRAARSRRDR